MSSRIVRSLVALLVASLLAPMFAAPATLAQPTGTPSADEEPEGLRGDVPQGPVFIDADGITSAVLAQAQVDALGAGSQLVLERLVIGPNDALPAYTSASTEILLVREGAVTIADSFGFSATTPAGQALTFAAGSRYELANTGSEPATVLRLATAAGSGDPVQDQGDVIAPSGSPEVAMVAPTGEVLLSQPIERLDGPVTLFLADAVFEPGSASGELAHDGPLGLVVEDGALDVLSPSGLTGQLQQGAAVVLPATAPLLASNSGTDDAVVLFAGVVAVGESLVSEITPTPVPTEMPTATPEPTAEPTSEPTEEPTPIPAPTSTPTPEPTAMPAAGAVLYEADTSGGLESFDAGPGWNTVNGMLVSDGTAGSTVFAQWNPEDVADYAVEAEIQFIDPRPDRSDDVGFGLVARHNGEAGIDAYYWNSDTSNVAGSWVEPGLRIRSGEDKIAGIEFPLDGEWHKYRLEVDGNQIRLYVDGGLLLFTQDNKFLGPGLAGLWVAENTQINVRLFQIVTLGGEITGVDSGAGGDSASSDSGQVGQSSGFADVTSLLPTTADVPDGLVEDGRRTRTLPDVADNYTDAAETTQLFTQWGWQENAVASFALPPGQQARSGEVNGVYVSIHRFTSADGARAALDFSLTEQAAGTALQEVIARQFGEYTRALYGPTDYGNELTLLTQQGDLLIRVSVAMLDGDATVQAEAVMGSILGRATTGSGTGSTAGVAAVNATSGTVPQAFLGSWTGQMVQVNPDLEWSATIVLTSGGIGAVVGTTNYPIFACGGNLVLEQLSDTSIAMIERLTSGQESCTSDGTVILTLTGTNSVEFSWTGINRNGSTLTASGSMSRD